LLQNQKNVESWGSVPIRLSCLGTSHSDSYSLK